MWKAARTREPLERLIRSLREIIPAGAGAESTLYPCVKAQAYFRPSGFLACRPPMDVDGMQGFRIFCDQAMPQGERLRVEFFLANGKSTVVNTRVQWVRELPHSAPAKYEVGLKLLVTPPHRLLALLPHLSFSPASG